jgi:hypothetical protein
MGVEEGISLKVSKDMLRECITDLYINPKKSIVKWSKITNQTAQGKFAYPSQHLASLITKIKGCGTAARGDDLADGSEVKSCSRADQLNECADCGTNVLAWQNKCPKCGSEKIKKDTSSHWIFPITTDEELGLLLKKIPRIILILFDKEDFSKEDVRIRAWTINPKEKHVINFFTDYYENNYKKKIAEGKDPAPCNFHPLKYDFYLMRPKLIFYAEIINNEPKIVFWNIDAPREQPMPSNLLSREKLAKIFGKELLKIKKEDIVKKHPFIPDKYFAKLEMKKKILKTYKRKYVRR